MNKHDTGNVIPLFPDQEDAAAMAGWDPYIFSILAESNKAYARERRRMPRPLTAACRRALLIATMNRR